MAAEALFQRLRSALIAAGDPSVAAGKASYFKGVARMHGLKSPQVDALFSEHVRASLPAGGRDLALELSGALLRSEWHEEKHAGVLVLHSQRRELLATAADALGIVAHVGAALDDGGGANDWATCDDLCGRVLRPAVEAHATLVAPVLHGWAAAPGTWRRRASAVAFVCVLRRGDPLRVGDGVLASAAVALQSGERFVQLGVGWALRELAASGVPGREAEVAAFLVAHAALISREGLRYATEKMPLALRARMLAESGQRAAAAVAAAVPPSEGGAQKPRRRKRSRVDQ